MLFASYPFCHEEHLKSPLNKETYFSKLEEPGVIDITNRNKSVIEPFGEMVEQALLNLHAHVVNPDLFSQ